LLFQSPFLKKLRDAFVIVCDPSHDGLGFGVFHVIGDSAYFLGSKAPKLWIVRSGSHLIDPNCNAPPLRLRHQRNTKPPFKKDIRFSINVQPTVGLEAFVLRKSGLGRYWLLLVAAVLDRPRHLIWER
jgi:hypothetical protein